MKTNRILLSLVIGALVGAVVGFKASADQQTSASIFAFIAATLVSLLVCWKMGDVLVDICKIPELRNRILVTLGLLAIFRFGFWVYLPGINITQFKSLLV